MNTFKATIPIVLTLSITLLASCGGDNGPAGSETEMYDVSVSVSPAGAGTIAPSADSPYEEGETVELQAVANKEYLFTGWTGDIESTENPVQLTVDAPKEITAVFEQRSFYRAENGITIQCLEAEIGEPGIVDGTTYIRRTADQITPDNASTTCTTGITDMSELFANATNFNEDISHWDVSSVTDMERMFVDARSFNRDISSWDVSSVTNMGSMFWLARSFNGNIDGWDVSSVTTMRGMFADASSFNQDIGRWDVSSIENMVGMVSMFAGASSFDQDISNWCVENIDDEPTDFAVGSPLTESNKPVWGTCPE